MKNILLPLALITLLLGPGCLLHVGDPENRHTESAEVALSAPPGATVVQRFRVTADEVGAPRLLDLAARASVSGRDGVIALRLRDVATGEEIVVDSPSATSSCSTAGPAARAAPSSRPSCRASTTQRRRGRGRCASRGPGA